jgi:5-methylcytosine-specific restriction endonuclease McrA
MDSNTIAKAILKCMVKYKKIYIDYFDFCEQDFIPCEKCHGKAVDIHHIKFKSQGGKDEIDNLIALCRGCHDLAHEDKEFNNTLNEIHKNNLKRHEQNICN